MTNDEIPTANLEAKEESAFQRELQQLINRHSRENNSNTPDFILASFVSDCLVAFEEATRNRNNWLGHNPGRVVNG